MTYSSMTHYTTSITCKKTEEKKIMLLKIQSLTYSITKYRTFRAIIATKQKLHPHIILRVNKKSFYRIQRKYWYRRKKDINLSNSV